MSCGWGSPQLIRCFRTIVRRTYNVGPVLDLRFRSLVQDYLRMRFLISAARPSKPEPRSSMLAGSGTDSPLVPTTPVAPPQLSQMMSIAHEDIRVPGGFVEFSSS